MSELRGMRINNISIEGCLSERKKQAEKEANEAIQRLFEQIIDVESKQKITLDLTEIDNIYETAFEILDFKERYKDFLGKTYIKHSFEKNYELLDKLNVIMNGMNAYKRKLKGLPI